MGVSGSSTSGGLSAKKYYMVVSIPKGMGLAKNLVFWTPTNVPSMYPMRIRLSYIIFKAPIFSKKVKMDIFSPN